MGLWKRCQGERGVYKDNAKRSLQADYMHIISFGGISVKVSVKIELKL